jgi:hypothetical protein
MKKVHEILHFVRLETIAKRWHARTTIINLLLDLLLAPPLADGTQVRPKISPLAVDTVTVLTPSLMKESGTEIFTPLRGLDDMGQRLLQAVNDNHRQQQRADSPKEMFRCIPVSWNSGEHFSVSGRRLGFLHVWSRLHTRALACIVQVGLSSSKADPSMPFIALLHGTHCSPTEFSSLFSH